MRRQGGDFWIGMMFQGAIAKFDIKEKKFTSWSMPPEMQKDQTQVNMLRAELARRRQDLVAEQRLRAIHRIDLKTGHIETWSRSRPLGRREPQHLRHDPQLQEQPLVHRNRGQIHRQRRQGHDEVRLFQTPTKPAGPRRGMMDAQDRLWFGEYRGNRIGMFDTRTEQFKEWPLPTPWTDPYDVVVDKNERNLDRLDDQRPRGASRHQDRPVRRVPAAEDTNIRRVFVDNTTSPVTFWVGSNHGASISSSSHRIEACSSVDSVARSPWP